MHFYRFYMTLQECFLGVDTIGWNLKLSLKKKKQKKKKQKQKKNTKQKKRENTLRWEECLSPIVPLIYSYQFNI